MMSHNTVEHKVPEPIIHVRADSDSCMEELFTFGLKPPDKLQQIPLRKRNLPPSFFNPPNVGGSRYAGDQPTSTLS